ncbi:hypothetical protein M0804_001020 [Polistes exclamans]|nr:hypothetical protein M0804_001020 [Polistes exclamans]
MKNMRLNLFPESNAVRLSSSSSSFGPEDAGPKRFPTICARLPRTRPEFLVSTARCNELNPQPMMRMAYYGGYNSSPYNS